MQKRLILISALLLSCAVPDKYSYNSNNNLQPSFIELYPRALTITATQSAAIHLFDCASDGTRREIAPDQYLMSPDNQNIVCTGNIVTAVSEGHSIVTVTYKDNIEILPVTVIPAPDFTRLKICEIMYDPVGTEPDGEYIVLYNSSTRELSLEGVSIIDGSNTSTPYIFSSGTIHPFGFCTIAQSATIFRTTYGRDSDTYPLGFSLNNSGESIFLKDPAGTVIDAVYIKAGTADYPAIMPWGSLSAPEGKCLRRKQPQNDSDTPDDFESGEPLMSVQN